MQYNRQLDVKENYSFNFDDPACFNQVQDAVYTLMMNLNPGLSRNIIYLCVGTDRATGDCLGPLVGNRLKTLIPSALIYGTLEEPVHAANLDNVLAHLSSSFDNPLIVAVDACLGKSERIGYINVKQGGLKPGTALGKTLPQVGDFHISGIVNVGGFLEFMVLQNTRLHIVYKMAEIIARGVSLAHYKFDNLRLADFRDSFA
ncbi:MAG: spore protease YyaC [Syntrophomonadaceae bacterium]|nr:spore protease YyaC [Syntrophomonadaceae bacterium]